MADALTRPADVQAQPAGRLDLARWIDLPSHRDSRGVLTVVEGAIDLPFEIRRIYVVHDVTAERGGHAHRDTEQVVVAVSGRCELRLSDGRAERAFVLDNPARGVLIGPMLFIRMTNFSPGAVLLSMASTHYDTSRSIRSWEDYLTAING